MTKPEPPLKLAHTIVRQIIQVICGTLMLLFIASPLPAVDLLNVTNLLYVTMGNNIVTFDTTSNDGAIIVASKSIFISLNLNSARGLAFDTSGNLYAANSGNNTISKFNSAGNYLNSITSNLNGPYGLAFDSLGNLYAANTFEGTIIKFNSAGVYQNSIASNLETPYGIAFDTSGNLYATNSGNSTINGDTVSKYNSSGDFQSNISSNLVAPLVCPTGLAFDSSGNLFVANNFGHTISKYSSAGVYQPIGSIGRASLNTPSGLAFDSSGNLYVANETINSINKYDSSGTFVTSWNIGVAGNPRFLAFKPVTVPEPSTYALVIIATGVMFYLTRCRKAKFT
jgi:sugar lactone lactonase YvrE